MKKIYIYRRFERFWHWTQALLILFYNAAIIYFVLLLLVLGWIFFTGEWHQYVPKRKQIKEQMNFYLNGIFKGKEHPKCKTISDKFNDLQRLTYFFLEFFLVPLMVITGLIYLKYNYIKTAFGISFDLKYIAYIHIAIAFFLVAFVIAHIYLTTTGYKPMSAIKAMISGWEEMSDEEATISLREYLNFSLHRIENKIVTSKNLKDSQTFENVFSGISNNLAISQDELHERLVRSSVGYFKISAEGKYLEVNEIWEDLYSCSNIGNPVGKNYLLDRTGEDKDNLEYIFAQVMKGKTLTGMKVARYCTDGTKRFHTISINPIKKGGKVIAMEGYIIDLFNENE